MKLTLAFDVYGTLINTSGVYQALREMTGEQASLLMDTWRNKQLEYSFRRGLMKSYIDFSQVTRQALLFSCKTLQIELSGEQQEALMQEYTRLPAFPDVPEALRALKADGHRLYAFSNGSKKAVDTLLNQADILPFFDGTVSIEDVAVFKPSPEVYAYFNQKTNSEKAATWLISGNTFDVIGALSFGMKAAWLKRSAESVFDPWDIEPTVVINSIADLPAVFRSLPDPIKSTGNKFKGN